MARDGGSAVRALPIPWPTRRCRSGSRSSGWCDSRGNGIYSAIAATLAAFIVSGGVGWTAHGVAAALDVPEFHGGCARPHRLYVVEVRHPVEVPGSDLTHLQAWLTKRCGWDVRAPERSAAGLKLVGGRLLPGPTGPTSFLMYESASGERFYDLHREGGPRGGPDAVFVAGRRRRVVLGRSRRGLCRERRQRPLAG